MRINLYRLLGVCALIGAVMAQTTPGDATTVLDADTLDRVTAGRLDPRTGAVVGPLGLGSSVAGPLAGGLGAGPFFIGLWAGADAVSTSRAASTDRNP